MSGHSKWSTIKRQKGVADAKRSALFSKLARQISLAARAGKDPEANFKLRLAIDRARAANLPNTNIERAVKAGSGELAGSDLKELTYEGYGPGNVAVLVQALTDNPNRTAPEIRSLFSAHGGSLGAANSVAWMFQSRGVFRLPLNTLDPEREARELALIDAGADDVIENQDELIVYTPPEKFATVRAWLSDQHISPTAADLELVPQTTVTVDQTVQSQLYALLEALDAHDDVTAVYTNEA